MTTIPLRRIALWGVLVAALLLIVALFTGRSVVVHLPSPAPPVLGTVPAFSLTNRDGRTVTRETLAGSPWIADFVFTRCAASCPMMTARLAHLNRDLPVGKRVHLVSFSVDPDHDTSAVLARYAASFHAPPRWLFLTGTVAEIHRLSREGFKLAVDIPKAGDAGNPQEPILHSTRFVLVDGQGRIRGYYDGFDEEAMGRLQRDLKALG
ncbi:MAG TPA: SCO family protein [Thermoanaerobaculia bacterium]|nr:SCO family protein [Thermoanaerobaculia bacterium]